jgi:hypothetical protein
MLGGTSDMELRREIRIMEENNRKDEERRNHQTKLTIGIIGICGITYLSRNRIRSVLHTYLGKY